MAQVLQEDDLYQEPKVVRVRRTRYSRAHMLTNVPGAAPEVTTEFFFPGKAKGSSFLIGEPIRVLCHFRHTSDHPLNVTGVMGSLNSPIDFGRFFQNFSYQPLHGFLAEKNVEHTYQYSFQIEPDDVNTVEYQVALTLFYESNAGRGEVFSSVFFNETVALEHPSMMKAPSMLTTVGVIATLIIAYLASQRLSDSGSKRVTVQAFDKESSGAADDWGVSQTKKTPSKGTKRVSKKKRS